MKVPSSEHARERIRESRVLRMMAGTILLVIGLAGLLLPILPGWLLIFVGLGLLGVKLPYVDRLAEHARDWLKRRGRL